MKEKKKLPLIKYMACLLAVSILFTGVTFSRYTMSMSGDMSLHLSRFHCSYTVEDISATSFPNVNYWLENNSAASTARTIRYTITNQKDGVISDVDVRGHLRMYIPAEMAGHLAFQIGQMDTQAGTMISFTPEIVFEELIFAKTIDEASGKQVIDRTSYLTHSDSVINTATFRNYFDDGVQGAADEDIVVNGSLDPSAQTRVLTAVNTGGTGMSLTVTASSKQTNFSLGFHRGKNENDYAPQLYLDLQKETEFYTFDISLPSMLLEGGKEESRTYVLYMSLTERINVDDYKASWTAENTAMVTTPPDLGEVYYYNDAKVMGYHFDHTALYHGTEKETTVRVRCLYDNEGGYEVSLYHVAPISEDSTANYVHPITPESGEITYDPASKTFSNTMTTGVCSNNGDPIYLGDIEADPFGETMNAFSALSKSYETEFSALFVQAS